MVHCVKSASVDSTGHQRLGAPMLTTWASATEGSARRATIAVRTVFSCVASRDRGRAAPAPGSRDAMSTRGFGGLRDVGSNGYSWSSSIAGTDAHGLGFGYNGVNPQYYSNRANGLQLRCLQEHPQGVLLGLSQPNLNRACQARKFVLGRGAARHSNRAASTPGRGRRCFAPRPAQPKARPGFPYDGRRHPRRKAGAARHAKVPASRHQRERATSPIE